MMRDCSARLLPYCRNYRLGVASTTRAFVWNFLFASTLLAAAKTANALPPEDTGALLTSAIAYHQKADYARSIPILKQILQTSPRNYDANLLLGEDLLSIGNRKDSLTPLRAASEVRPEGGVAQAFLADAAAGLGDYSTASEAFQSAVKYSGEGEQFLVAWADFSLQRSFDLAKSLRRTAAGNAAMLRVAAASRPEGNSSRESLLKQSAAADPAQRGIWGELGSTQVAEGKFTEAQVSLREARKRQPEDSETLRLEALFAAMEERWPDAEMHLSTVGTRSPAELNRILALWPKLLFPGQEVTGKVWDCLREKTTNCPEISARPGEGNQPAKALYAEGRWEQLLALPSIPDDDSDSLWRGVAFSKTGDCPHAIPLLERGLKADLQAGGFSLQLCYASEGDRVVSLLKAKGDDAALHQLKGDMVLRLHNDAATAVFEYAEALNSRPQDPHLLARLADAYKQLGEEAKARESAQQAVALDAHESSALHTLAQIAMSSRDYDEAIARLKQLLDVDPEDQWAQAQLGVAYGQSGNPEEALHYLGPLLAANYPDPKGALHAMLAKALRKLGRQDEANKAADEAARLANSSLENSGSGSADAPQ
jgi:tetratricopeptide (TPR) repeat protein